MTVRFLAGALLALLLSSLASAQDPEFRGPELYQGAWQSERAWSDPADGDLGKGSYAYHYRVWAEARAQRHAEEGTRLDCADLSIALICEYAALNRLPLEWRVYYPPERRFVSAKNSDKQFKDAESFQRWSQHFLGAMNLADNTDAVTYEEWAGGDMVLMDWNQSEEAPNFGEREVWHTYLIGKPDEWLYYGNISGGEPLPVTRVNGGSRMEMVRTHPDRYGYSPRRFRAFRGAVWAPASEEAEVIRVARSLNLRSGPGTDTARLGAARRGERLRVIGHEGLWVKLSTSDGREVWAHGRYLQIHRRPLEESLGISAALALGASGGQ